jgi:hypothetical protein
MAILPIISLAVYRTPAERWHRPEAQATDTSGHVDNPADGVKFRRACEHDPEKWAPVFR